MHRSHPDHAGIIICMDDGDRIALAERIHTAIFAEEILPGKLVSVVRPMKSAISDSLSFHLIVKCIDDRRFLLK